MTAYLPKIFTTYNNRGATPSYTQSPETLSYKAFRASLTLTAAGYIGAGNAALERDLPLGEGRSPPQPIAQVDDHSLPLIQALRHAAPDPHPGIPRIQFLQHIIIHTDDIHQ